MSLRPITILQRLTPVSARRLLELAPAGQAVAYMENFLSQEQLAALAERFELIEFDSSSVGQALHEGWERVYFQVEKLFQRENFQQAIKDYYKYFYMHQSHTILAYKKAVVELILADCQLISQGEALFVERPRIYLINQPELMRLIIEETPELRFASLGPFPSSRRALIRSALGLAHRLVFGARPRPTPAGRYTWLFDLKYEDDPNHSEFKAFWDYFKNRNDVLYRCPTPGSPLHQFLQKAGKPVLAGPPSLGQSFSQWPRLVRLFGLATRLTKDSRLPVSLRAKILWLFEKQIFFTETFSRLRPRYYLRMRPDMDTEHPIAAGLGQRLGVRTVGFSHGSYPLIFATYAYIDFDYYGLLGRCFKEKIYKGIWPEKIKYLLLGPFTVEGRPTRPSRGSIAIFPQYGYNYNSHMTTAFMTEFIEAACQAVAGIDRPVVYKTKNLWRSELELLQAKMDGQARLEIAYHRPAADRQKDLERLKAKTGRDFGQEMVSADLSRPIRLASSQEVLDECELAIVMADSTVGFEAIGKLKKTVIYQLPWKRHPFEDYLPQIVVRNAAELQQRVNWLLAMPEEEYRRLVIPLVENCSKVSTGRLVADFIEAVERNGVAD